MKILLVDDDHDSLEDVANAIEPTGFEYDTSDDPEEALKMFVKGNYDLVVTDVRMPKMDGITLLGKMKKMNQNVKVIVMTAFGDLNTAIAAINNGAYSFFAKPLNFKEFIDTLDDIEKVIEGEIKEKKDMDKLKTENESLKKLLSSLVEVAEKAKEIQ